jgi:glycosyltransferase involved in cell wall biosynthesis
MRSPKISVGIPVFNGERYLPQALNSVLRQDYEDFELIVSDNASTDATEDICREFAGIDKRIRYHRNVDNLGAVPNFNRVFNLARGTYFKWLSHDDECYPSMLRRCAEVLDRSPDSVALVYPLCELINEDGGFDSRLVEDVKTSASRPYQRLCTVLFKYTSAQALCGLIRSDCLRRTRLRGSYVFDDCGLLAELAMLGRFLEVQEVLLRIRVHARNAVKLTGSVRSHAIWLDPVNQGKRLLLPPRVGLFVEHLRSIRYLPLGPLEKFFCYLTVPVASCGRPMRNFAGRQKARLLKARRGSESESTLGTTPKTRTFR